MSIVDKVLELQFGATTATVARKSNPITPPSGYNSNLDSEVPSALRLVFLLISYHNQIHPFILHEGSFLHGEVLSTANNASTKVQGVSKLWWLEVDEH